MDQTQNTTGVAVTAATLNPVLGYSAYSSNPFGGHSQGDAGRYQRELNDRRNALNQTGANADIMSYLNGSYDPNNQTAIFNNYANVNAAGNADAANFARQLYGDTDKLGQYAYDSYVQKFGKAPTQSDFAQIMPYFTGANGRQTGDAYLATAYKQYLTSPEYAATQAAGKTGDVNSIFNQYLGRNATDAEIAHYGQALALGPNNGGIDQFNLGQQLQGGTEYQTAQDTKFRGSLADELGGYDAKFLEKNTPGLYSQFANATGGAGTSSALQFALADMVKNVTENRDQYLSGLSAQQYGGDKQAALADYNRTQDQNWSNQNYTRDLNQAQLDYYRGRSDNNTDYLTQMSDYQSMQGQNNQSRNVLHSGDWLNLGMQGLNTGAQMYGASQKPSYNYFNY